MNISFNDPSLLERAFTHRSYLNEAGNEELLHNERLEFLGDAVLELVVTQYLFAEYPHRPEGELTAIRAALVNTQMIGQAGRENHLNDFLRLSKGEAKDTGRARLFILANTYEAVIGAIYLDQGFESAYTFVENTILDKAAEIVENNLWQDAKSLFQEQAQAKVGITPTYETLSENGPDHDKVFTVGVFLENEKVAEGAGKSKQDAEQEAAREGLEAKGWS